MSQFHSTLVRHETYSSTLNINPRNCVGTVISLNGHRKYFCVFHASVTMPGNPNRVKSSSFTYSFRLNFNILARVR